VTPIDPLDLARRLIRCRSVTPAEGGALDLLQGELEALGLVCHRLPFGDEATTRADNLYARLGDRAPNFCFAGHTDVVPAGDPASWSVDPFGGEVVGDELIGRGAADMKGGVACFVAAISRYLADGAQPRPPQHGSISVLITGDEEGRAINGTRRVLQWMSENGERIDACLLGEPTSPTALGEVVKHGRRGSLIGRLTVHGRQGHSAYPQLADNPIPRLVRMLARLIDTELDRGSEHFESSTLALTSVDVGNPASNVIPERASAMFNIRFNDLHSADSLGAWLRRELDMAGGIYDLELEASADVFVTPPGALTALVQEAVEAVTGRRPALTTGGGTSDARFIKDHCPVVEFGLVGQTMHQVDERVAVGDLYRLSEIYAKVLETYFAGTPQ
jgi:succinyl-diaminopimelate desuccinylase